MITAVVGWDIGGVNTKVARVETDGAQSVVVARTYPFEIQRDPAALGDVLSHATRDAKALPTDAHAVTMTAELSQLFRTKREGVGYVLDSFAAAFPESRCHVYTVDGHFVDAAWARAEPLKVAASNWVATAAFVAQRYSDVLLIDVGSTTTDIIPIVGGSVAAIGRTD